MTRHPRTPTIHDGLRLDLIEPIDREIALRAGELGMRSAPSLNQNGWRSDSLLTWTTPAVCALLATLCEITSAGTLEAWAMVNWHGSHHPRHIHRGSLISGIYYVRSGGEKTPPTIFEAQPGPEIHVEPVAGRLVLFPSDLYHRVPPYHGKEPRVTVAFDVKTILPKTQER